VVFEPVNQIARARNCGARAAQGRFLLFVDADTTISSDLLAAALAALADGTTCGGGATLSTSDTIPKAAARMITLWNWISRRSQMAAGCFLFCLREGWEAVGGFPTSLYAGEELKFSRALRRWGKKRGLRFRILPQRVDTSMRKVEWFTPWQIRRRMLGYMLFPWRLRRRDACAIWYERPKTTTPPPDNEDTHHA
jgi:glycosyltransferase involved in cell wall biosynthesis